MRNEKLFVLLHEEIKRIVQMKSRIGILLMVVLLLLGACKRKEQHQFTHDLLLPMTPVKNQGKSELCWAYAMLATIETEHILRGDSVNLSAVYIGRRLKHYQSSVPNAPASQRAMGMTLLNMIQNEGIVGYDVLPDDATEDLPTPQWVFSQEGCHPRLHVRGGERRELKHLSTSRRRKQQ